MKNFTVTNVEVKTIYSITISEADMEDILEDVLHHKDRDLLKTCEAFQSYDLDSLEPTRTTYQQLLSKLWNVVNQDVKTVQFIVREILGFDGVVNYGFYNSKDKIAQMIVYKRGDRLNV